MWTNIVIEKVSDGDLQTVLEGQQYLSTPQKVITVGDMINYYNGTEELILK